jgi:hypothetical protein
MNNGDSKYSKIPEQYIALSNFEFGWSTEEVKQFRKMWKDNISYEEIVDRLRPTDKGHAEVLMLIIDQLYKNFIQPRKAKIEIGGLI